jgi:hypothetical protein
MTQDIELAYGWSSKHESDSNRLKLIQGRKCRVSSSEAEVSFEVNAERVTPGTEIRGHIIGPRSLYGETVGFVSPLRSVRHRTEGEVVLIARTSFAHPGFWDPQNPLLYRVVVELWQGEQRCDVSGFDLGFCTIELVAANLIVNKKPLFLQGMRHLPESPQEAVGRRNAGYNLVLAGQGEWNWWVRANPMGFLLLEKVTLSTLTPQYIHLLRHQPCFFGFVVGKELLERSLSETESFLGPLKERGVFIGLEIDEPPPRTVPKNLSFLVCPESILPALSDIALPKIVAKRSGTEGVDLHQAPTEGVLGSVHETRKSS